MARRHNAISLFSGCGGLDIGVRDAGFDIRACVEIDPYCCETLRANIERQGLDTVVFEGDVCDIDPAKMLKQLALRPGQIDLLFGGPPCQSFSQIGKQKALADERGKLIFQMPRFAKVLKPKAILMEEVKGLLSARGYDGKRGGAFAQLVAEFEELGYTVFHSVLTASDYGVAQHRQRLFTVAIGAGKEFHFPDPSHADDDESLFPLPPIKTVGEALRGLGEPLKKEASKDLPLDSHYDVTPKRDRERIHGVPEGDYLARQTHLPVEQRGKLSKKDTTKFLRLDNSKPANTLRGGEIFFHPTRDRYLTPREYMRIHSYPDSYILKGPIRGRSGSFTHLDQHRQVANSVPPLLARRVASRIMEAI